MEAEPLTGADKVRTDAEHPGDTGALQPYLRLQGWWMGIAVGGIGTPSFPHFEVHLILGQSLPTERTRQT